MTTPEEATVNAMQAQSQLLDTIGQTFEAFVVFCKANAQRVDLMSGAMQEIARATVLGSEDTHALKGFVTTLAADVAQLTESYQEIAQGQQLVAATLKSIMANQDAMMTRLDGLALGGAQAAADSG